MRRFLFAVIVFAVAAGLAACSSAAPKKHYGAAEPADAPAATAPPAGRVVKVGAGPEGIVYDPQTDSVAVAVRSPDRLLVLDPRSLAVRRTVSLPGSVRHLQLARPGGPVLVPAESANTLVQVTLPDGRIAASTAVGRQPHDAADVDGLVVVGDEFGRTLSVIDGGSVVRTIPGVRQPGGVVAVGSKVVAIDVNRLTLTVVDPTTGAVSDKADAGLGPTHGVATAAGELAVTDTRGNALLLFSVDPLRQVAALPLPGTPYGLALDRRTNTAWVTLTARNEVVGIDLSGARPVEIARYPTVEQPNTVAVAPGSHTVWVTGTRAGVVQRIDR